MHDSQKDPNWQLEARIDKLEADVAALEGQVSRVTAYITGVPEPKKDQRIPNSSAFGEVDHRQAHVHNFKLGVKTPRNTDTLFKYYTCDCGAFKGEPIKKGEA